MSKAWFRPKRFGYGFTPSSWEGVLATIAYIVSWVLQFVLIGYLTGFATWVAVLVFSIMAAMAANKGEEYTYPLVPKMVT